VLSRWREVRARIICGREKDIVAYHDIGSGIGALASHIQRLSSDAMFPSVSFPSTHNTPILKAAYIFSHLS